MGNIVGVTLIIYDGISLGIFHGETVIEPIWRNRPIMVFKRSVLNELIELGMDLWDVIEVLEDGFDCERSTRETGVIERCVQEGDKILKVVVMDGEEVLPDGRVPIWILRHVGRFTRKKGRW